MRGALTRPAPAPARRRRRATVRTVTCHIPPGAELDNVCAVCMAARRPPVRPRRAAPAVGAAFSALRRQQTVDVGQQLQSKCRLSNPPHFSLAPLFFFFFNFHVLSPPVPPNRWRRERIEEGDWGKCRVGGGEKEAHKGVRGCTRPC